MFHVDDIISAGSEVFTEIMKKLRTKYNFGKVEKGSFAFTGLNISQTGSSQITLHQKDYIEKLEAPDYEMKNPNDRLPQNENRMLRQTQGQLSWLSSQTRPDISFDSFYLSTVLNKASFKDAKISKKILKRIKKDEVKITFQN